MTQPALTTSHIGWRTRATLLVPEAAFRIVSLAVFVVIMQGAHAEFGSALVMGYSAAGGAITGVIATAASPALIARFGAKAVVIGGSLARLILFGVFLATLGGLWFFVALATVHGFAQQIQFAAKMEVDASSLPSEGGRGYYANKSLVVNVAVVAGPPIGGVFATMYDAGIVALVLAAFALVASLLLLAAKPVAHSSAKTSDEVPATTFRATLANAPRELLLVVFAYCVILVILECETPLIFPFVADQNQPEHAAGVLLGVAGAGGILGALLCSKLGNRFSSKSLAMLIAFDGVCLAIFALLPFGLWSYVRFVLLGVMGAVTLWLVESVILEDAEPAQRPVLYSVMQFLGGAGGAIFMLATTASADVWSAKAVLVVCALVELAVGGLLLIVFIRLTAKKPAARRVS